MMANWQRHLRLNPEWEQAQDDEISYQELAASIARKLRALEPFSREDLNEQRDEIADEFEWMAGQPDLVVADIDAWMDELYDWGDIHISGGFFNAKKVCWIDTIGAAS